MFFEIRHLPFWSNHNPGLGGPASSFCLPAAAWSMAGGGGPPLPAIQTAPPHTSCFGAGPLARLPQWSHDLWDPQATKMGPGGWQSAFFPGAEPQDKSAVLPGWLCLAWPAGEVLRRRKLWPRGHGGGMTCRTVRTVGQARSDMCVGQLCWLEPFTSLSSFFE